jgi:predicted secreted Zn-dependent protease
MKRLVPVCFATLLAACAAPPRGSAPPTALTSVDTAYYVVPGLTRAEWTRNLPRAAEGAGIRSGAVAYTVGRVAWSYTGTHIASSGCRFEGLTVQLRLGHVMPRLATGATPTASQRGWWDTFVGSLWDEAHAREAVGARLADSLRAELRRSPNTNCAELVAITKEKVAAFPARYTAALMALEAR